MLVSREHAAFSPFQTDECTGVECYPCHLRRTRCVAPMLTTEPWGRAQRSRVSFQGEFA